MIISGITYEVIAEKAFAFGATVRTEITLRRPKGKRIYHVVRYEDGSISEAV